MVRLGVLKHTLVSVLLLVEPKQQLLMLVLRIRFIRLLRLAVWLLLLVVLLRFLWLLVVVVVVGLIPALQVVLVLVVGGEVFFITPGILLPLQQLP
jgi:hypothetical protein